ncbi:MAG TPA: hypothetical protein VFG87_15235 [Amycolatopsis sp.]|jgi:hypothetical protein|nr:hypothetical protein [Amycolatopsis sp.]
MSVDTTAMGVLVAELMDAIADEYGGDVQVGTIAVVVEIDAENWTQVRYRCSDPRSWVQEGFFLAAQRAVVATREAADDEPDEGGNDGDC